MPAASKNWFILRLAPVTRGAGPTFTAAPSRSSRTEAKGPVIDLVAVLQAVEDLEVLARRRCRS